MARKQQDNTRLINRDDCERCCVIYDWTTVNWYDCMTIYLTTCSYIQLLFSVSPIQPSGRLLLTHANPSNRTGVTSSFFRRFSYAFKCLNNSSVFTDKQNLTSIVWKRWNFGTSLVCTLNFCAHPSTVIRCIWTIVINTVKSTCRARCIIVVSRCYCPFFKSWKIINPFGTNSNSSTTITRIIRCVLVKATCFHTSPHMIKSIFFSRNIRIELVNTTTCSFNNSFFCTTATRKRVAYSQCFTTHTSYRATLATTYPHDFIGIFIQFEYGPSTKCHASQVLNPRTSLFTVNKLTKLATTRLLSTRLYIFYRSSSNVSTFAFKFP